MAEPNGTFRRDGIESTPTIIPLGVTVAGIVLALTTFFKDCDVHDLPVNYATTALYIGVSGLAFSFYVCASLTQDLALDPQQGHRQRSHE